LFVKTPKSECCLFLFWSNKTTTTTKKPEQTNKKENKKQKKTKTGNTHSLVFLQTTNLIIIGPTMHLISLQ
jgi:spermidine synthase